MARHRDRQHPKRHIPALARRGHWWTLGMRLTDAGLGLPTSPADAVAVDPRDSTILYVATDVGVFVSNNGGGTWAEFGNLPNVAAVAMLVFNSGGTQKLRVATHGRGVWQTDL